MSDEKSQDEKFEEAWPKQRGEIVELRVDDEVMKKIVDGDVGDDVQKRTYDDRIIVGDSRQVRKLIGTFAGFQIESSEYLRQATYHDLSDDEKIAILYKAKESAVNAMRMASTQLEEVLAFSQLTCATGLIALVRLGSEQKGK